MSETEYIAFDILFSLVAQKLLRSGLSDAHASAVAKVIVKGERDACRSHGLYRLQGCLKAIASGKLSRDAEPEISEDETVIIKADAKFGFSCLAFERAVPALEKKAKRFGLAALVINNCFHFSALWPEVEMLADAGLAAIALNPSSAYVAPAGGTKAILGTNPFAFAWPRVGNEPYVFDFATSEVARGEVELHRLDDKPIPLGWGLDHDGNPTTSAAAALQGALLTFGGHKGSALSTMIELLGGALIDDLTSGESTEFDEGIGLIPCHGELIIAFSPEVFGRDNGARAQQRAENLFSAFTAQGARLPSSRRYQARKKAVEQGILVSKAVVQELKL
jgi:delta1-piperideine-2-carboxylate reductase